MTSSYSMSGLPLSDNSTAYITWRRRRVHFDPKVSATMPRPTPAMLTPALRHHPAANGSGVSHPLRAGNDTSVFFSSQVMLDDTHWIPQWLRDEKPKNSSGDERGVSQVTTTSSGACSSVLPGEPGSELHPRYQRGSATVQELISSPMCFTQRLLDLHDEMRDVEEACHILVRKAMKLDPKTHVTEILEGSSELSYHSIKVDAVDGEIRRIQREITGTFSVLDGAIIAGSEAMPAEKCTMLLDALRACIPEVRSSIRLAETRLTSLLMN